MDRRFRAGAFLGAVESRLQWAFHRARPPLEDFLRRDAFDETELDDAAAPAYDPSDDAGDPRAAARKKRRGRKGVGRASDRGRRARTRSRGGGAVGGVASDGDRARRTADA